MTKIAMGAVGCLLVLLATASSRTRAGEYSVEWTKNGEGSQVVDMISTEANPTPWHTINDPMGVNLRNSAGFRIKSIRIKATAANVTFRVVRPSSDAVFPTIWKRKNNREVAFLDGDIARNAFVWNRVNDTSGATGTTANIFEGQIYGENYTIPDPENWEQVATAFHMKVSERWKKVIQSLPEGYNTVDSYAESDDGSRIFFTSRGFPFVYDFKGDELRSIIIPKLIPRGTNLIRVTKTEVELWQNGSKVDTVPLGQKARYGDVVHRNAGKR